jgi:hypothetical protein
VDQIAHVRREFNKIYYTGVQSLLNDTGAFLSFICVLTGIDAVSGFLSPSDRNGDRFKKFVRKYMPQPLAARADDLWDLRNYVVHAFNPGPQFGLCHRQNDLHLTEDKGRTILNAENFFAAFVSATDAYFDDLRTDGKLQKAFQERVQRKDGGVLVVLPKSP